MDTDFKDIKKQYNELKALWGTEKSRNLSDEEALRYQDVLELLQERGYIMNLAHFYTVLQVVHKERVFLHQFGVLKVL